MCFLFTIKKNTFANTFEKGVEMMATIFGYARCSTNESRQDIDRQRRELKRMGASDATIYFEYESGIKDDRIELKRLFEAVKPGDIICVTEVSRLTRSTRMLCDILEEIKDKKLMLDIDGGVSIDCRNEAIDPITEGMIKMWGVFSEMERNITISRIKSGIENAKAKGIHCGRSKSTVDDIPPIFYKYYQQYNDGKINLSEMARLCEMSRTTIYKYIKLLNEGK